MSDTTNGFLVRGEFTFPVYDDLLPDGATHQDAMDYARRRIESAGGGVVPRAESEVDWLRSRVSLLQHYVGSLANKLGVDNPAGITHNEFEVERIGEAALASVEQLLSVIP